MSENIIEMYQEDKITKDLKIDLKYRFNTKIIDKKETDKWFTLLILNKTTLGKMDNKFTFS